MSAPAEKQGGKDPIDRNSLVAGGIMILIGAFVLLDVSGMRLGTPTRMGPGFYPMLIGIACIILGLMIAILEAHAHLEPDSTLTDRGVAVWRSRVFVPLSMLVFALLLRPAGLAPASVGLICVACLAAPHFSLARLIGLIVVTPLLAWFIFVLCLGLPFEMIRGIL
ncbi:tripartite tricarboxylate transporter TctB family protein [uncultured Martelella sp.]|uniref:tripartite tricarboxylate transporter TctB family protein n=1 Tax=uncultured Martelella sp. TaxID=392331 RepID=UPI0029C88B92|nr:tripartite tricarboxylate transporter TctB family protein [uncultured Martelella sp.]